MNIKSRFFLTIMMRLLWYVWLAILGIVVLFSDSVGVYEKRMHIYHFSADDKRLSINAEKMQTKMERSWIQTDATSVIAIVPRSFMRILNPVMWNAESFAIPYINIIMIADDLTENTSRSFEGTIVREMTKLDTFAMWPLQTWFLPEWKTDGVADYVSAESSLPTSVFHEIQQRYQQNRSLTSEEKSVIYRLQFERQMQEHTMYFIMVDDAIVPRF